MKARYALLVAVLVPVLAGCADDPPPKSGYVERKEYSAAHDDMQTICYSYDSNGNCTLQVPSVTHYDASWSLCLVSDDRKSHGCVDVDEATWNRYSTGQHYPDPR